MTTFFSGFNADLLKQEGIDDDGLDFLSEETSVLSNDKDKGSGSENEEGEETEMIDEIDMDETSNPTEKEPELTEVIPFIEEKEEPLKPEKLPQIHNIVATVNLTQKIKLKRVSQHAKNSKYNPKRFPAVIVRIRLSDIRATGFVFRTGKIIVLGCKTVKSAKTASRVLARIVQKTGHTKVKWTEFKISNMLASAAAGFKVNLAGLSLEHHRYSTYEPELFPGLVYRMLDPKVTLMVFMSGKVVMMGKSEKDIKKAFNTMFPLMQKYKQKDLSELLI